MNLFILIAKTMGVYFSQSPQRIRKEHEKKSLIKIRLTNIIPQLLIFHVGLIGKIDRAVFR
jgi:hypothetical protein